MKQRANITWFEAAYSGFVRNALTTIPATSIALLVFEIMRTKLSDNFEDYNDVLEAKHLTPVMISRRTTFDCK